MIESLVSLAPWAVVLIVFIGMAALQWRVIGALDQALARTVPTPAPKPVPTSPSPAPPPPVPAPVPVSKPVTPSGPFGDAPSWFQAALREIGFHETGANQGIDRYIQMGHCGSLGDAWCAIFANAMLEQSGIPGTRSASSQSFRTHPGFVQLTGPALGAVVVFWRGSQDSGLGHVGFYRGEDASKVWVLGGNENDMVQIEALPKSSQTFGLVGYWWPKSVALPTVGPVLMPTGSPTSVTTPPTGTAPLPSGQPGVQQNIIATYFGGQQSAYGGAIDDNALGVALPFRFAGDRPFVRVTGVKNGVSVVCKIVDVGPWNGITPQKSDPYWQTGTRPQAESGTDLNGRHTNGAGIDLTLAAAKATQIDGKGLVNWQFITDVAPAPSPTVT